ncbi:MULTISPECIES: hypothetical protein [Rhodopseudomonas]|uniref:Uncharacterized protein n=1 Tax=Rhodopseudomonas palustris TaxID=1076 RepID=A0A0D7EHP9_RHOPL|nr:MULTISPECIES: hypothetical protein [Rhodopseudomonas]KIZ39057.1 hypothetical protein OO17_21605 [Rhodopseudomonas palustris]MDF3809284.1 hypothetical protein [Rhodopseudomonas sp. BAL398]WOK19033.1 hypothetical protein RBJ75_05805 [Rhodopseudomonas sp. BAL398]
MSDDATLFGDTPHTQLDAATRRQRGDIERACGLDFAGCNVATAVLALNEFDLAALGRGEIGHRSVTWPAEANAAMARVVADFSRRNGGAKIVAVTEAIGGEPACFIMAIHWRAK